MKTIDIDILERFNSLPDIAKFDMLNNLSRGIIVNAFCHLEHLMADITITANYKGGFAEYYKGKYVSAENVVKLFIECWENEIPNIANKYFNGVDKFREDITYLKKIRHQLAHYAADITRELYKYSSQDNCFYLSAELQNQRTIHLKLKTALQYSSACLKFHKPLRSIQLEVEQQYKKNLPPPQSAEDIVKSSSEVIIRSSFDSIR